MLFCMLNQKQWRLLHFLTFIVASAEISSEQQLSIIDVVFTETVALVCSRAGLIL